MRAAISLIADLNSLQGRKKFPVRMSMELAHEPRGDFGMALAEPAGRNADPDADREAPFGREDHVARATWVCGIDAAPRENVDPLLRRPALLVEGDDALG